MTPLALPLGQPSHETPLRVWCWLVVVHPHRLVLQANFTATVCTGDDTLRIWRGFQAALG